MIVNKKILLPKICSRSLYCIESISCCAVYILAPFLNDRPEVFWEFRGEVHLLVCYGMHETESLSMKSLTGTELEAVVYKRAIGGRTLSAEYFHAAIALIGKEWMPDCFHVSTNLVCAPCFEYALHESCVSISL